MEDAKRGGAAARAKVSSNTSGTSVLRSLQSENDSLRSELLRSQQHASQLQLQLSDLRATAEKLVKEAAVSSQQQVRALEERCRLLADRIVGSKREEQVSETARVSFLLRSQLEERRFLKRALEAMQETLGSEAGSAASASQGSRYAASSSARPAEFAERYNEVHTGDLYRLVMAVSDGLHAHNASAKLEKARTRLTLEQAATVLAELHRAVENATRAAFDAAVQAADICESDAAVADASRFLQPMSSVVGPSGSVRGLAAQSTSDLATPSARRGDGSTIHRVGASKAISPFASSWIAPSAPVQLALELEWVCDVLKACVKGAAEVGALMASAADGLKAPPPLPQRRHDAVGRAAAAAQLPLLAATASSEMNALLGSFLEDLRTIKQQAAQQQEDMARQLAHEVERHFHSTQQYEQRIRLLETECARLLRHAERQAARRSGTDAATQTAAAQRGAVTSASGLPAVAPAQDAPVTPERYVASRDASRPREQRRGRQPPVQSAEVVPSHFHGGQRTPLRVRSPPRSAPPPPSTSEAPPVPTLRPTAVRDSVTAKHSASLHHFQHDDLLAGAPYTPARSSSAVAAVVPSPAASAIWSAYRDRHAVPPRREATVLAHTPRSHAPLLSPAPAPPPALPDATLVLSPKRRGTAPFRTDTSTATLSPVSPTSERRSPFAPSGESGGGGGANGLVSSQPRTHAYVAQLFPPEAPRAAADTGVDASADAAPHAVRHATPPQPLGARHGSRFSQQLYDEAAADVFSAQSAGLHGGPVTLPSTQRLYMEPSRVSDGSGTAGAQPSSPRRPVRLVPTEAPAPGTGAGDGTTWQHPSSTPLASHAHSRRGAEADGALAASPPAEAQDTPLLWRRIREEASASHQLMSSPMSGGNVSGVFGTPREVSWMEG